MKPILMSEAEYERARPEWIRFRTIELTGHDGKYYPFSSENFSEAVSNMSEEKLRNLSDRCEYINTHQWESGNRHFEVLGRALYVSVFEYWEKIADKEAEETCPNRELMSGIG